MPRRDKDSQVERRVTKDPPMLLIGRGNECTQCPRCRGWYFDEEGSTICGHCVAGYVGGNPSLPTTHPPGSWEKCIVMAMRYESGLEVYHPEDNPVPEKQCKQNWHRKQAGTIVPNYSKTLYRLPYVKDDRWTF